jgi:hypothetical protein
MATQRRANPAVILLPSGVRVRRFALRPTVIEDASILFYLSASEFASANPRSGSWIGWQLASTSRRSVTNEEHMRQIEDALRSALRRNVIVCLRREDGELFFAPPATVGPDEEIVSDKIVFPPRPRALRPSEVKAKIETQPPPPPSPPPPPPRIIEVDPAQLFDVARINPFSVALFMDIRLQRFGEPVERRFTLDVHDLGRRLQWAPQRVESAIRALVAKRLLVNYGRDISVSSNSTGSYIFGSRAFPSTEVCAS